MNFKGLLIAPSIQGVSWAKEIRALTDNHNFSVLTGDFTVDDILEAIVGDSYDLIHFAAHGNENGILVSPKEFLKPFDLVRVARRSGARLVFINSCSSSMLAQLLIDNGVESVIAYANEVDNVIAWDIARTFYDMLGRTGNFRTAYDLSSPRDGTLLWLQTYQADVMRRKDGDIRRIDKNMTAMWIVIAANLALQIAWWFVFLLYSGVFGG